MADHNGNEQGGQRKKRHRKRKKRCLTENGLKAEAPTPEADSSLDKALRDLTFDASPVGQSNLPMQSMPPNMNSFQSMNQFCRSYHFRPANSVTNTGNMQVINGGSPVININSPQTIASDQPKEVNEKELQPYLDSTRKLEKSDFPKISICLGNDWKFIGRSLGIEDSQLDMFEYNNKSDLREMCYKMLTHWASKDPSRCTVGNLAKALFNNRKYDVILKLPTGD